MSTPRAVVPSTQAATTDRFRFSPGVIAGGTLHCSGQLGGAADGELASDPEAQFEQAFRNVEEVLTEAGASWADVVEMTTFHVALSDHLEAFVEVRNRFITEPWPAWTAIGITALARPGALVEIKVTATVQP